MESTNKASQIEDSAAGERLAKEPRNILDENEEKRKESLAECAAKLDMKLDELNTLEIVQNPKYPDNPKMKLIQGKINGVSVECSLVTKGEQDQIYEARLDGQDMDSVDAKYICEHVTAAVKWRDDANNRVIEKLQFWIEQEKEYMTSATPLVSKVLGKWADSSGRGKDAGGSVRY